MLTLPPLIAAMVQREPFPKASEADAALIRGIPPLPVPSYRLTLIAAVCFHVRHRDRQACRR